MMTMEVIVPGFMKPQIKAGAAWVVSTTNGTEVVPADLVSASPTDEELQPYCEGTVTSFEKKSGYLARMSAPGYLDATEWSLHESQQAAEEYLK